MNDLLGILLPLLMSGAGMSDIFRAIGGMKPSSVGMDGLSATLGASSANAMRAYPLRPNRETIIQSFNPLLERLGINPYSGGGQGAASILSGLYKIFPDTIGTIVGIPNGSNFFSTIANGSAGISMASGMGRPDMFNPYSVTSAHKRTADLAKMVYDMGIREGGGYNIGFGHGLNMDEMGKVSQRILSSDFIYRNNEGDRYNLDDTKQADEFKKKLKDFGSKINESISMMNKVTGSLDETLRLMDNIGGGNFLGGTEEQARSVANRAKRFATAIRVTSAMAGMTPAETWRKMQGLQYGIMGSTGLDIGTAMSSGFGAAIGGTSGMAAIGTMGAAIWAAMNPMASQAEKEKAFFVANGRTSAYARSSAAAMSAAIADNLDMFSEQERKEIMDMYRSGNANGAAEFVRRRIGDSMYNAYLTDPAMRTAAIMRIGANPEAKAFHDDMSQAGIEGNTAEADRIGTRKIVRMKVNDLGTELARRGLQNKGEYNKESMEASRQALIKLATSEEGGFSEAEVANMKLHDLRRLLMANMDGNVVANAESEALIDTAIGKINENTLSADDEEQRKQAFIQELSSEGGRSADLAEALKSGKITFGAAIAERTKGMSHRRLKEFRQRVTGGMFTSDEAAQRRIMLNREKEHLNGGDFTAEERMAAIENEVKKQNVSKAGQVKGFISSEEFKKVDDRYKIGSLEDRMNELASRGEISFGEGGNFDTIAKGAISDILEDMFGDSLGGMKDDELKELKKNFAERMYNSVRSGKSLTEAYGEVASEYGNRFKHGGLQSLGAEGYNAMLKFREDKRLGSENLYANIAGQIDKFSADGRGGALDAMKKLSKGDFGKMTDSEIVKSFTENAKRLGISANEDDIVKSGFESVFSSSDSLKDKLGNNMGDVVKRAQEIYEKGGNLQDAVQQALGERGDLDDNLKNSIKTEDIRKLFVGGAFGSVQKEGLRKRSGFNAAVAGGSAQMAALNFAAVDMIGKGMDFDSVKSIMKEMGASDDFLSKLDDITANGKLNPFSNAIQVGGSPISNNAIKNTEAQIDKLSKALKDSGLTQKDLEEAYGEIDPSKMEKEDYDNAIKERDAKKKDVESRLKKSGFDDSGYAGSLYKGLKSTFGSKEAGEILTSDEKRDEAKKDKGKMAQTTRDAARADSPEYKAMKMFGDVLDKIAPFITNPKAIFSDGFSVPVEVRNS